LLVRSLYTNRDLELFSKTAPIILNGIGDVVSRSDLLDRAICIHLPDIPAERRRPLAEIQRRFDAELPRMLGALCNAWSCALRSVDTVSLERPPRMADFARWVAAATPALPFSAEEFK